MFTADQYELLDFGAGRKLERFGAFVLDRPAPAAADFTPARPALWEASAARYDANKSAGGGWKLLAKMPDTWSVRHGGLQFELRLTDSGQVGLFPEQAENWDWLVERIAASRRPLKLLNLFAYTGGSTLAAAAAGASITHVDAAANVVAWARRNAEQSGLAAAPIRWIVDDALGFVRREVRRGAQYDGVILDPPSYGHGRRGEPWKFDQDLPELLEHCAKLLVAPQLILLTCHSPGWPAEKLRQLLESCLLIRGGSPIAEESVLRSAAGHPLPSGVVVRWSAS